MRRVRLQVLLHLQQGLPVPALLARSGVDRDFRLPISLKSVPTPAARVRSEAHPLRITMTGQTSCVIMTAGTAVLALLPLWRAAAHQTRGRAPTDQP